MGHRVGEQHVLRVPSVHLVPLVGGQELGEPRADRAVRHGTFAHGCGQLSGRILHDRREHGGLGAEVLEDDRFADAKSTSHLRHRGPLMLSHALRREL
jgi:hypothetical protein